MVKFSSSRTKETVSRSVTAAHPRSLAYAQFIHSVCDEEDQADGQQRQGAPGRRAGGEGSRDARVCAANNHVPLQADLLSRLKHPNIVSYKESFQDAHCVLHIVMGYCEGRDLASRLQSHRGSLLPEAQVVEWFVQITLALQVRALA